VTGSVSVHSVADRVERLAAALRDRQVDALLVETPANLRYLTGFTGSHGLVLVAAASAQGPDVGHWFFTDFRYTTQSAEEVSDAFRQETATGDLLEALPGALSTARGRLGFDDASLTVSRHARLGELLGQEWALVPCAGAVERLRAVKDAGELARIRAVAELADEALRGVLEDGVVRRTERDVAIDLELRMRRLGAEAPSFPAIVAAGTHGALPHAAPRDQEIPRDVLVTIDWGAQLDGYCSDCTRTYATGESVSGQMREIHELVRTAQEQALAAVRAGPSGRELDAVARAVIERAGYGEYFGHGLGHGVGLEIHERPRLSRTAGEERVRAGNVVTVEPGVYLPGTLGVRIEDLVVVAEDGQEELTRLSKALAVIP
jgi:Xaa-Pro aminopeptidase